MNDAKNKKLSLRPKVAKPLHGAQAAWWYEEPTGITVYISSAEATLACQISRASLRRWLAKVTP